MHQHARDYTVPFGPQYPGMKEPMCLKLHLKGNYIEDVGIRFGYVHRGIEKMLEGNTIERALYIVERVCGLCGGAYTECYVQAIEKMLRINAPARVRFIRTIVCELERIQSHLLWSAFVGHEIGYDTLFMFFMRERERILEAVERITGARIHKAMNKIGTIRYDIADKDKAFILERAERVEKAVSDYLNTINADKIILARLRDVGTIDRSTAKKYCLVGPVARGSGINNDTRKISKYAAYGEIDFDVVLEDGGDALARAKVRLREVLESIGIIRNALKQMPDEKIPLPMRYFLKESADFGRVEAPRGELFQFIKIKNDAVERIRLRPPTLANILILNKLLIGREIGDVPVIIGSLDPCFGCMERVMIVKGKDEKILDEKGFKEWITRSK